MNHTAVRTGADTARRPHEYRSIEMYLYDFCGWMTKVARGRKNAASLSDVAGVVGKAVVLHGIASDLARTSVVCDDSTKSYAMAGGDQSFQTRMRPSS